MKCGQIQDLLIDYLGKGLSPSQAGEVEKHLDSCRACQEQYKTLQVTINAVKTLPTKQPDDAFWAQFPDKALASYKAQQQSTQTKTKSSHLAKMLKSVWPDVAWPRLAAQTLVVLLAVSGIFIWSLRTSDTSYHSVAIQTQLSAEHNLANLVSKHSIIRSSGDHYAFSTAPGTNFFRLGMIYSETVGLTIGGDFVAAKSHMRLLQQSFVGSISPASQQHIATLIEALQAQGKSNKSLLESLSRLQTLLEKDAAAQSGLQSTLILMGVWTTDMKLAAAAENTDVFKQPHQADLLATQLTDYDIAKGAINAMNDLQRIMKQQVITQEDYTKAIKLVERIQTILG